MYSTHIVYVQSCVCVRVSLRWAEGCPRLAVCLSLLFCFQKHPVLIVAVCLLLNYSFGPIGPGPGPLTWKLDWDFLQINEIEMHNQNQNNALCNENDCTHNELVHFNWNQARPSSCSRRSSVTRSLGMESLKLLEQLVSPAGSC